MREAVDSQKAFGATDAQWKILLSEREDAPLMRDVLSRDAKAAGHDQPAGVALGIGPEGGWTDAEITPARAAGFMEASLGENILRTETAVIAALAILHFAMGT
jgi:16S rRNA (uracil1498-N3)-methyltransferase